MAFWDIRSLGKHHELRILFSTGTEGLTIGRMALAMVDRGFPRVLHYGGHLRLSFSRISLLSALRIGSLQMQVFDLTSLQRPKEPLIRVIGPKFSPRCSATVPIGHLSCLPILRRFRNSQTKSSPTRSSLTRRQPPHLIEVSLRPAQKKKTCVHSSSLRSIQTSQS